MDNNEKNKKNKLYLTVGFIMVIIVTAWILNLKNNFPANESRDEDLESLELQGKWEEMSNDLSRIFNNIEQLKTSLEQTPTTTGATLQGGPQISPDELDQIAERLRITTSTPTNLELSTTTEK